MIKVRSIYMVMELVMVLFMVMVMCIQVSLDRTARLDIEIIVSNIKYIE